MIRTSSLVAACAALACLAAHAADPALHRNARIAGDGNGHGIAQRGGAFTTPGGVQGGRTQRLVRTEEGAVGATSRAGVSGDNGSAASTRTATRSADMRSPQQSERFHKTTSLTMPGLPSTTCHHWPGPAWIIATELCPG